jgi:fermentation-respiration switch protein FrsA (DUF1100 family)
MPGGPSLREIPLRSPSAARALGSLLVALLVIAVVTVFAVGTMLSRPVPVRIGSPPPSLLAERVEFRSDSGPLIRGWLSRATAGGGAVLLLPALRANRLSMVHRAQVLRAAGYSTLLIDFQATGESEGDRITFGWRERLDVVAAVRALRAMLPREQIGIIGVSLGGAATLLAAPQLDVDAAILEAVYPSIDVAVENRLRIRFGVLGAALSPLLLVQLQPRLDVGVSELRPVDRIAQLRCPVFVIGGTADRHTTLAETQQLYAAAREPKELWLIPNVAHVDLLRVVGEPYRLRVLEFLNRTLRQPTRSSFTSRVPTSGP